MSTSLEPHAHHHQPHDHANVDWAAMGEMLESEGELLGAFVHDAASWIEERSAGSPIRHIVDVGSGPGVGSCIFAERFPSAIVTAFDTSEGLLARAEARAARLGVDDRFTTRVGDLGTALAIDESADVVWASMMLHHVTDQGAAIRNMRAGLRDGGWLAIAEFGSPLECIPPSGMEQYRDVLVRCQEAVRDWLPTGVDGGPIAPPNYAATLRTVLAAEGFQDIEQRELLIDIAPPVSKAARKFAVQSFTRLRQIAHTRLTPADLAVLDELLSPDNAEGLHQRDDLFVRVGRSLITARAAAQL